ncbi:TPA: hypothetical protein QEM95_11430 [Stenotrophomonas maltophilia]|nr:hypothetical protein [Stenotrophomonas maltophilia]
MAWIYCPLPGTVEGGVGPVVGGVSRMDAATELTWTYLQRPPQPDPPRLLAGKRLLLLRLPASGRHYRRCRAQPCRPPFTQH